jgi:hypothetical protein
MSNGGAHCAPSRDTICATDSGTCRTGGFLSTCSTFRQHPGDDRSSPSTVLLLAHSSALVTDGRHRGTSCLARAGAVCA